MWTEGLWPLYVYGYAQWFYLRWVTCYNAMIYYLALKKIN